MSPRDVQTTVDQAVTSYLRMPYTRMLIPDPDEGGFIAEVLELPGCLSQGETPDEAFSNLDDAMGGYIASLLDRGYSVPEPMGMKEYPGRLLLRISNELHRAAATRAMHEGVSLNQWIGQVIAERLAAKNLADEIVEKLRATLTISMQTTTALSVQFQEPESGANDPDQATLLRSADDPLHAAVIKHQDTTRRLISERRSTRNA